MAERRAAVLLDRDGTIIVERDYLSDPALVALETGAAAGLRAMAALGLPLIVLTNQSGVGRGYFTLADVGRVNDRVDALLRDEGVTIAGWYICPHAPGDGCDCRKPGPGLARQAAADHALDLAASFLIGDKSSDMGTARAVGACGIMVATGHAAADRAAEAALGTILCANLQDAAAAVAAHQPLSARSNR